MSSSLNTLSWQCDFKRGWDKVHKYTSITHDEPFSEGACRYAYHALYTKYHETFSHGKKAIVKRKKKPLKQNGTKETKLAAKARRRDSACLPRESWDKETKLAIKAKYLVDLWNKTSSIGNLYTIHIPEVKQIKGATIGGDFKIGEWVTIEPYIQGKFIKWNSNSGWFGDESLSVHAFCHWTYHQSEGNLLLCDAQGVRNGDSYAIADPAICSAVEGLFGMTDLGVSGIAQWFRHHRCNKFCDPSWIRHSTVGPVIPIQKASSYTQQKRSTRSYY